MIVPVYYMKLVFRLKQRKRKTPKELHNLPELRRQKLEFNKRLRQLESVV